jgi:hypothetical protein
MSGVYAIAEVTDDSNKRPQKTIFCYLEEGFAESQIKSLKATGNLVKSNGAQVFSSLEEVVGWLNSQQLSKQEDRQPSSSLIGNQEVSEQLTNQQLIIQQEQPVKNLSPWGCCGKRN